MLLREQIITEVSQHLQLTKDDYEIFKYGFMILYINITKTLILLLCAICLGIVKETAILFFSFLCVRLTGFGPHSDSTIKCTIIGLLQFIGGTCIAIHLPILSVILCTVIYLLCILVCCLYAPVVTNKRPISKSRQKVFKVISLIINTGLYMISLCVGECIYRNLIIIGALIESIMMLPIMKKIIL